MILAFFDHEPALARMCVVQALRGGPAILEYREEVLAALAAVLDEGCPQGPRGEGRTRFTAEGLVGGALAILYARLLRGESGSLSGLLGELMGVIVLPYLGPAAARREQVRAASDIVDSSRARRQPGASVRSAADPLEGLPMRVTYRTARVIEVLAAHPGASNRAVSEHAGIHDQGQVSKLLARLERLGLVVNRGGGPSKGEPNAWYLTALGTRLAQRLSVGEPAPGERAMRYVQQGASRYTPPRARRRPMPVAYGSACHVGLNPTALCAWPIFAAAASVAASSRPSTRKGGM